ncbi:MAG: hypothetical protein AAEJ47_03670 [Planctomycetota bacterium]
MAPCCSWLSPCDGSIRAALSTQRTSLDSAGDASATTTGLPTATVVLEIGANAEIAVTDILCPISSPHVLLERATVGRLGVIVERARDDEPRRSRDHVPMEVRVTRVHLLRSPASRG